MNIKTISLDSLSVGDSGFVSKLLSKGGLVKGTYVESLMKSPVGGLTAYLISGAVIAIRPEDARYILINKQQ